MVKGACTQDGFLRRWRQTSKCANNRPTQFPSSPLHMYQALAGGDAHELHRPAQMVCQCRSGRQDVIHLTRLEEPACCFHYTVREAGIHPDHGPDARRTIHPTQRRHLRVARRGGGNSGRRTHRSRRAGWPACGRGGAHLRPRRYACGRAGVYIFSFDIQSRD